MTTTTASRCENCGSELAANALACTQCGALTHRRQLEQISEEALRTEPTDPFKAAMIWRQCLSLLPPDAEQYRMIRERMGALSSGMGGFGVRTAGGPPPLPVIPESDPWPLAFAKTAGSMLVSILLYMVMYIFQWHGTPGGGLIFACGFTGLILVHEMGHVLAMRYYGLSAGPPIFIPFMGALIRMRQSPKNAWVESVVGIGGPALGTVGAIACVVMLFYLPIDRSTESFAILHALAYFGILLNLFNLLPFPPLDGGRIVAGLSPWLWLFGVVGIAVMFYLGILGPVMGGLILFLGLPRIIATLRDQRLRTGKYYAISRGKAWQMGAYYTLLAGTLTAMAILLPRPWMFS